MNKYNLTLTFSILIQLLIINSLQCSDDSSTSIDNDRLSTTIDKQNSIVDDNQSTLSSSVRIQFVTSMCPNAGTDATIYISLADRNNRRSKYVLVNNVINDDFENGFKDSFEVDSTWLQDLEDPDILLIQFHKNRIGFVDHYNVNRVTIIDNNKTYQFDTSDTRCSHWLDDDGLYIARRGIVGVLSTTIYEPNIIFTNDQQRLINANRNEQSSNQINYKYEYRDELVNNNEYYV